MTYHRLFIALAGICILPASAWAQPVRVGTDFQVNTYTSGYQRNAHIAFGSYGLHNEFAIAWDSTDFFGNPTQDGSGASIQGNVFDWDGTPTWQSDWQINTYTTGDQTQPRIGFRFNPSTSLEIRLDYNWTSAGQDGDGDGQIYAGYDELGQRLTVGDLVLSATGEQTDGFMFSTPSMTGMDFGEVRVTWEDFRFSLGSNVKISGGTYGSSSQLNAQGGRRVSRQVPPTEFQVNTFSTGYQGRPAGCSSANGNFVVTWSSFGQEGEPNYSGIYAQRFNSSNVKLGTEFRVNTYTTAGQDLSQVCCQDDGSFLVVWESGSFQPAPDPPTQDGSDFGLFGQRYNSAGAPNGTEFQINTYTTGFQHDASLACDGDGNAVVVWQSTEAPTVSGQAYSSDGSPLGTEFEIVDDPLSTRTPYGPSVALGPAGLFVVAWSEFGNDGSAGTVLAQRFTLQGIVGGTTTTTIPVTTTTTLPLPTCGDPSANPGASSFTADRQAGPDITRADITATDALLILSAAVGSFACDACVCDVNSVGGTTATDALIVLQSAVGQSVVLNCPACT